MFMNMFNNENKRVMATVRLVFVFCLLLCQSLQLKSQNRNILDGLFINGGAGFFKMSNDSVFDESLGRPYVGASYEFRMSNKWVFDLGLGYATYGGRSQQFRVYQTFKYVEMPMMFRYQSLSSFNYGLGFAMQYHLESTTRKNGVHSLIEPNVFDRSPTQYGLLVRADAEIPLNSIFNLYAAASISLPSYSSEISQGYRHFGVSGGLRLNIGGLSHVLSKEWKEDRSKDSLILSMKRGTVVVVLRSRKAEIEYLEKGGKPNEAAEVRKDCELKNKRLIMVFKSKYQFTNCLFMYSDDLKKLRENLNAKVFLNDNLNRDQSISLKNDNVFFLNPGNVYKISNAMYRQGYYYYTLQERKLENPFPSLDYMVNNQVVNIEKIVVRINRETTLGYMQYLEKVNKG